MPARISVIIPTLDAAATLPDCLSALLEGVVQGLIGDLVISDGGSRDATLELAQAAGAVVVTGPASRGGQLRRGCAAARGSWLLVLHADTVLDVGWSRAVAAHLAGAMGPEIYYADFGTVDCSLQVGQIASTRTALQNADSYARLIWCLTRPSSTILRPVTP